MADKNIQKIIHIEDLLIPNNIEYLEKMKLLYEQIGESNSFICGKTTVKLRYHDEINLEELIENYLRRLKRDFKSDE